MIQLRHVHINLFQKQRVVPQGRAYPFIMKKATIIPIMKPQKDPRSLKSYRPIAFTSRLCKLIERLIRKIVLPAIEKAVQPEQLGFLPRVVYGFTGLMFTGLVLFLFALIIVLGSTVDCLVRLEIQIEQGFHLGKEILAVFLDMTAAFDRVNIPILMAKLRFLKVKPHVLK
ncbi:hypothetical protein QYM36_017534 [Artemia franciscana]|uniref:Reverse transcriptase domain-containing protein n=1 Tax=Artemia franciscana TaxID=6661 RepID=A0AA88KUW9_ARTSF|nr:hypothetical protein QYM36_017534 [Artemia franciscana]